MELPARGNAKALLVDPSRFTAPYDGALAEGLAAIGIEVRCATRQLRPGEGEELPPGVAAELFYRHADRLSMLPSALGKALKGLSHLVSLLRLGAFILRHRFTVVHFQWAVVPVADAVFMRVCRLRVPVVLTVHDAVPFNGETMSFFQNFGFDLPVRAANRVIVHTTSARDALVGRGHAADKIEIIPHGPLALKGKAVAAVCRNADTRWTFTLFGQLKPYKGIDVLLEAIKQCREELAGGARFIIAGAARMDMAPVLAEIEARDLGALVDLRLGRLSDDEMATLFSRTDCFLFPYRQIDASGVFFLTRPLDKWMIASNVGIFAEGLSNGVDADLVPPGDAMSLARAIAAAARDRPTPNAGHEGLGWIGIAQLTAAQYRAAAED